jgi:eukaryotic-like serine/threonine-protein kinase
MTSTVTLVITQGRLSGQRYIYDAPTTCIMGRHADCQIRLPSDADHAQVSRYHCSLHINPPQIHLSDLGSGNGTFVNGHRIGSQPATEQSGGYELKDGDRLQLGYTIFTVMVETNSPGGWGAAQPVPEPPVAPALSGFLGQQPDLSIIQGYQVLKTLGSGKCGAVYLALHEASGELVALKVMSSRAAVQERSVQRFIREMSNTKALHHPNVVKLLDYGEVDGIFFFTMECCHEGNVADFISHQGGKLPLKIAISITLQILLGLDYTHNAVLPAVRLSDGSIGEGQGLVHRDLKPANIFLSREGKKTIAKLGDYGLSKAFELAGLSGQTVTGQAGAMGTPSFMCRQQLLNTKYVQPAVDVWAAAACLYMMLTGEAPRRFGGGESPLRVILQETAVPILERDPTLPPALAAVIDRALWEDPDHHNETFYKRAIDFRQALLEAAAVLVS